MTGAFTAGIMAAFWFGILTSISPCPLTTNIVAVSYIGQQLGERKSVFFSGVFYALGRVIAYVMLASLIVVGLLSVPRISVLLNNMVNRLIGPVMILVGMFLLELISIRAGSGTKVDTVKRIISKNQYLGSFVMGFVFALSFCPVSAALFFGSLIPLALKFESSAFLPVFYGFGTALPVFFFALLIAAGSSSVAKYFNALSLFESYARKITGVLFIGSGIYLSLIYIFKFSLF